MVATGVQPTWKYGVEACGLTDAKLAAIRSHTARAVMPLGKQACPVTAVRLKLGTINDPLVITTKASVDWFTQV